MRKPKLTRHGKARKASAITVMGGGGKKADLGSLLSDIPRGAWVALSQDETRVVVFHADLDAVMEQARAAGETDPVLIRVPDIQMALVL